MASIGVHTNGSQFYLALNPMPQLNGRCVAFARVIKGNDSIESIEKVSPRGTFLSFQNRYLFVPSSETETLIATTETEAICTTLTILTGYI